MPWCLGWSGSVRAIRMPSCEPLGAGRPDLLAVHDPLAAVAHGARAEAGQVAAGVGLAEQLAPDLLAGEQGEEVALLLLLGAGVDDGRAGPADADRVRGARHPGPGELVVDEQLVHRVGVETPRAGPVGRDVAGLGEHPARRLGMVGQPGPDLLAARVVVGREFEVHRGAAYVWRPCRGGTSPTSGRTTPTASPTRPPRPRADQRVTWAEFDRRADGIAAALLDAGARAPGQGRPLPDELPGVPRVDVRHVQGRPRAGEHQLPLRRRRAGVPLDQRRRRSRGLPRHLRRQHRAHPAAGARRSGRWLWVDDGSGPCPDWAVAYEDAAASADGRVQAPWGRSGDDLYLLYTGGTTGMPKGVMWRQDDIFVSLDAPLAPAAPRASPTSARCATKVTKPGPGGRPRRAAHARHRRVQRA